MIRSATTDDLPAVLGMVKQLHASTRMTLPIDDTVTMRTLDSLVGAESGLLLVSERASNAQAFIAATIGYSAISMVPIGMELGWWATPGSQAGLRLLILYERWAKSKGCHFIRMSTPPHNERAALLLSKRGFFLSEHSWAKAI